MIQLLTALSLALSCAGPGQDSTVRWMPTWHTGDTWVVKELVGPPQMWQYETYEVLGTKHVGESDCYILEIQHGSLLASCPRARTIYDVRVRDLKMIRRIDFYVFSGKLQPPETTEYGEGETGPQFGILSQRWPRFPLDSIPARDTVFQTYGIGHEGASLRQMTTRITARAGERWLSIGDTIGRQWLPKWDSPSRIVRTDDSMLFLVQMELGIQGYVNPRPGGSLQLWARDLPWRLYEAEGDLENDPPGGTRRRWLVETNARRPQ